MTDEQWTRDLASAARGVRPAADAVGPVLREVRRRRARRRTTVVVGAAALAVAAVAVTPAVVGGPGPDRSDPVSPPSGPAESAFSCPAGVEADRETAPDEAAGLEASLEELSDRADQESAIADLRRGVERMFAGARTSWRVAHAEPSALGPVVLVGGDAPDDVEALLESFAGRDLLVGRWSPEDVSVGLDREAMVQQVLQWRLDPVVAEVRRATRGIDGSAGISLRQGAGAVDLRWKAPVPAEVAALAGVRPGGVEVVVEPVRYSERDTVRAGRRAIEHLDETGREWASTVGCADGSGLVVGIVPPVDDGEALARELADVARMPVMVRAEERPVPLAPGDG